MAENDVLKNELASQSGATTTTPASSPTSIVTGNATLDAYNQGREQQIRDVYAKARQNNLAALQTAYDQNLSNAQANRDKITPQYQDSMNQLGAEYERQRRNNNLQAQANGLNTGANSQMQLGQMNVYSQGQAGMQRQMNEALDTADRGILDLKTNYQNQISQAAANNDYQLAAALLDEYGNQFQRQSQEAARLAEYGDFSLYTNIYGADAARNMERSWMLQNPQLAYTLGKITADEYFKMTGTMPPDKVEQATSGGSGRGGYGGYYPDNGSSPDSVRTAYAPKDVYEANKAAGVQGFTQSPSSNAQAAALLQEYNNRMAQHYMTTTDDMRKVAAGRVSGM